MSTTNEPLAKDDLYARARLIVVESQIGYDDEEDRLGALLSVIGEMMLEAMDLGMGAHDIAEGLRALASRLDSAPSDESATLTIREEWLYGK